MKDGNCKEKSFARAIRDIFLLRAPTVLPGALKDHLLGCASCRSLYRTLALADRSLGEHCGASVDISPYEIDCCWQLVKEQMNVPKTYLGRSLASRWALAGTLFFILAIVVAFFSVIFLNFRNEHEILAARGSGASPFLQVVCISEAGGGQARSARRADGVDSCRIDETLGFYYLNPGDRFRGLVMFALDDRGESLWYLPDPARPEGIFIPRTDRFRALSRTVKLAINHRPGRYTLFAVFLPEPKSLKEIAEQAASLARGESAPEGAHLLRWTLVVEGQAP